MNKRKSVKKKWISMFSLLALISMLLISLAACSSGGTEDEAFSIDNTIIETYLYLPESFGMTHVTDPIHQTIVHEGRIYVCYVIESAENSAPPTIVVKSMLPDGTQISQTKIPLSFDHVDVAALRITDEGNLALILTGIDWTEQGRDSTMLYLEYSPQGVEVMRRELTDLGNMSQIGQAIFTDDGDMLLLASAGSVSHIYLLDNQFSLRGQIELNFGQQMSRLQDGRVVVSSDSDLREVDFSAGGWGETHPLLVTDIRGLYPARDGDLFDLYINDGTILFGYTIATGEKTPILNWLEARVGFGFRSHLNFLDDGRLSLLLSHGDFATEHWRTEHVILTRTPRAELPEYTVITLGVERVGDGTGLRERVAAFNREHRDYQIQLVEYWDGSWETDD